MPTYERMKMCSECPFRANAAPGWLGPLTIDDLEKAVHGPEVITTNDGMKIHLGDVGDMICHKSVAAMKRKKVPEKQMLRRGQQCVGMIRYANAVMKRAHRPEVREFQAAVEHVPDKPVIEAFKLREYHEAAFDEYQKSLAPTSSEDTE